MQQTEVRLKLELNDEVRRVTLLERSFQCLQKQVCQLFSFQDLDFTLKYKDDEGDLVTISSEEEFQEALGSLQQNLLRLKITRLNKEKQETKQERGGRCGRFRKLMEFKKWKEAQSDQENEKEDRQKEEEEETKPWKRFFMFKSPHGPQHPHPHHFQHHHQRPHHFPHHHQTQEGQQEENRQHPFFPPRFGPHNPHHFHRHHHHHRPQHQNEQEEPNFFAFPPRFGPHHPHHFHRHHHQQEETPRCRFGPRHGPFGIFGRPHHHHQHQQEQEQKEEAQTFDFLEKLGNLAKNLFGGVLNEESSLEELFENDLFKVEHNYICDGCDEPISGTRHHCTECPDFDFCSSCFETKLENHPQHKFEKVSPFKALKQALQNGQQIDAFLVKKNEEAINEQVPKQQEEKKSETQPEPQEPEQTKQEEISTTITNNVEVPQPTETTITVEPSTTIFQPSTEVPSEQKPKEEGVVVYPFQKKLEDLEVMGFSDRKKNILALLQNKGDLELTIEQLLN